MVALTFILLLTFNILGFALPALLAAWLMSWLLEISFSQGLWLSMGTILIVEYIIQMLTDLPGQVEFGFTQRLVSVASAYIFLALSALAARLFLGLFSVELSLFEAILLFTISLVASFFFLFRPGAMGLLPRWMALSEFDFDFEDEEDDYIITSPKKQNRRKSRGKRRGTN